MRFMIAAALVTVACQTDTQDLQRDVTQLKKDVQAMRAQIARGGGGAAPRRPPSPDPEKVYAVGVDGAPSVGPADAPVTVVIAYEYACPWCNKQRQVFPEVQQAYGDKVRFVYRPFVVHPDLAGDSALAACAAAKQGKFAEANDAMWTGVFEKRAFDRAAVEQVVSAVPGIDAARLRTDMDGDCKPFLAHERDALATLGVYATPQVWVNGRPIPGGYKPLEGLKPVIDQELARASERIAAGTPRASYYNDWVVKKGIAKFDASGS